MTSPCFESYDPLAIMPDWQKAYSLHALLIYVLSRFFHFLENEEERMWILLL